MKKAFTLIELLVVIAIIAILAAILFPVFAQAKAAAKKTQSLSNIKQESLGIIQYNSDNDDAMPFGRVPYGNTWHAGFSGWQYPSDAGQANSDGLIWGNSTMPYIKSTDLSKNPASVGIYNPYGKPTNGPGSSYTYNGVLQGSTSTAVVAPASTILVWSGVFNMLWVNRSWAQPLLNCPNYPDPCVYQPVGSTGNGSSDGMVVYGGLPSYSKWVHGQGDNFAFTDGHAKFSTLKGSIKNDPWGSGNDDGIVLKNGTYSVWTNGHTCLFGVDNPCGL